MILLFYCYYIVLLLPYLNQPRVLNLRCSLDWNYWFCLKHIDNRENAAKALQKRMYFYSIFQNLIKMFSNCSVIWNKGIRRKWRGHEGVGAHVISLLTPVCSSSSDWCSSDKVILLLLLIHQLHSQSMSLSQTQVNTGTQSWVCCPRAWNQTDNWWML